VSHLLYFVCPRLGELRVPEHPLLPLLQGHHPALLVAPDPLNLLLNRRLGRDRRLVGGWSSGFDFFSTSACFLIQVTQPCACACFDYPKNTTGHALLLQSNRATGVSKTEGWLVERERGERKGRNQWARMDQVGGTRKSGPLLLAGLLQLFTERAQPCRASRSTATMDHRGNGSTPPPPV